MRPDYIQYGIHILIAAIFLFRPKLPIKKSRWLLILDILTYGVFLLIPLHIQHITRDLTIMIDGSLSMTATDFVPNRFERALSKIRDIQYDRLIVFGRYPVLTDLEKPLLSYFWTGWLWSAPWDALIWWLSSWAGVLITDGGVSTGFDPIAAGALRWDRLTVVEMRSPPQILGYDSWSKAIMAIWNPQLVSRISPNHIVVTPTSWDLSSLHKLWKWSKSISMYLRYILWWLLLIQGVVRVMWRYRKIGRT